jgi:hypothetical protein
MSHISTVSIVFGSMASVAARHVAPAKGRNKWRWSIASFLMPQSFLVLLALPSKPPSLLSRVPWIAGMRLYIATGLIANAIIFAVVGWGVYWQILNFAVPACATREAQNLATKAFTDTATKDPRTQTLRIASFMNVSTVTAPSRQGTGCLASVRLSDGSLHQLSYWLWREGLTLHILMKVGAAVPAPSSS